VEAAVSHSLSTGDAKHRCAPTRCYIKGLKRGVEIGRFIKCPRLRRFYVPSHRRYARPVAIDGCPSPN
jgi:hypothetical protein